MEDSIKVCRICLGNATPDQSFFENTEYISGTLAAVVPDVFQQIHSLGSPITLCSECSQQLNYIYSFKYNCLKVEETILIKVTKIKSNLKLNLCDIMQWTDNTPEPLKNNQESTCRTCLRICDKIGIDRSCTSLLKVCIPELDINLTLNPDICKICATVLQKWSDFKMTFLNTENLIKRYCTTFNINIENIDINKLLEFIKLWNWQSTQISEYVPPQDDIKMEFDCSDTSLQQVLSIKNEDEHSKNEDTDDDENIRLIFLESVEIVLKPMKRNGVYMYVCPKCKKIVKNMDSHISEHGEHLKLSYQCYKCNYRNSLKLKLKEHLETHGLGGSKRPHKCDQCSFRTKQKGNLMTHLLVHKRPDEIQMFKCRFCKFQARQKGNLKTHLLTHRKPEEIEMFKCTMCLYQARQKGNLQTHVLRKHKQFNEKSVEEALFYRCSICPYKAKQKPSLKKHMATHV